MCNRHQTAKNKCLILGRRSTQKVLVFPSIFFRTPLVLLRNCLSQNILRTSQVIYLLGQRFLYIYICMYVCVHIYIYIYYDIILYCIILYYLLYFSIFYYIIIYCIILYHMISYFIILYYNIFNILCYILINIIL